MFRDPVRLWEDTVGDSGEAPTDEELRRFATEVEYHTLKDLLDYIDNPPTIQVGWSPIPQSWGRNKRLRPLIEGELLELSWKRSRNG